MAFCVCGGASELVGWFRSTSFNLFVWKIIILASS